MMSVVHICGHEIRLDFLHDQCVCGKFKKSPFIMMHQMLKLYGAKYF